MLLEELLKGSEVVLELIWGNMDYKIKTQVKDISGKGVLIPAFQHNGVVLDASSRVFQEMRFNLYGNDTEDQRICWKNLKISNMKKDGEEYYHLSVNVFNRHGGVDDQRGEKRIPMDGLPVDIQIVNPQDGGSYKVLLKDISNEGVAFLFDEKLDIVRATLDLTFSDDVRGHQFQLSGRYKCLRIVPQKDGRYAYGCSLVQGSRDLLAYIYLKRLLNEKKFVEKTES